MTTNGYPESAGFHNLDNVRELVPNVSPQSEEADYTFVQREPSHRKKQLTDAEQTKLQKSMPTGQTLAYYLNVQSQQDKFEVAALAGYKTLADLYRHLDYDLADWFGPLANLRKANPTKSWKKVDFPQSFTLVYRQALRSFDDPLFGHIMTAIAAAPFDELPSWAVAIRNGDLARPPTGVVPTVTIFV